MQKQEKLLREYISALLTEDEGGSSSDSSSGYSGYSDSGFYMGYGGLGGSGGSSATLIKPIKDVFQVLKGAFKTLFKSTSYLVKIGLSAALQILTTDLIEFDFKSLHNNYANDIKSIRSEYSQAVGDSYKTFLSSDLGAMAFFYNPPLFSAFTAAKAFVESTNLLEDKATSKKMLVQAKFSTQEAVDSYFENIKRVLAGLSAIKSIEELPLDDKSIRDLQTQLDAASAEGTVDRKKAEQELLKAYKLTSITRQVESLKDEKKEIIETLRSAGASADAIMHPTGLVAKYDREIQTIASML